MQTSTGLSQTPRLLANLSLPNVIAMLAAMSCVQHGPFFLLTLDVRWRRRSRRLSLRASAPAGVRTYPTISDAVGRILPKGLDRRSRSAVQTGNRTSLFKTKTASRSQQPRSLTCTPMFQSNDGSRRAKATKSRPQSD